MGSEADGGRPPPIIIDECLCFITNKIDLMDPDTVTKLCIDTFHESVIEKSKDLIFKLLHDAGDSTAYSRRLNKGPGTKSVKNVQDIWLLLQEKGNIPMPKFVAHDLGKLPPVHFDHIDVTVLFKRIENGNATINILKDTISTLSESNNSMSDMIGELDARMKKLEITKYSEKNHDKQVNDKIYEHRSPVDIVIDECEKLIDEKILELPFSCKKCDNRFKSESDLNDHIIIHKSEVEAKYNCSNCNFSALTESELNRHTLTHKTYTCNIKDCEFSSVSEGDLKIHMTIHKGEKTYKCIGCPSIFKTNEELKVHYSLMHIDDFFECPECAVKFKSKALLNDHLVSHKTGGGNNHKCAMCGYTAESDSELVIHTQTHQSQKVLICTSFGCNFRTSCNNAFKTHMDEHNLEKLYNCIECQSTFDKYEELEEHYLSKHTEDIPLECSECVFRCKDKATLEYHMTMHTGENSNKCPFCKNYFTDMDTFRSHIGNHLASRMGDDYKFPNKPRSLSESGNSWENNELARQHLIDSFMNLDGFSFPLKKEDLLNLKLKNF